MKRNLSSTILLSAVLLLLWAPCARADAELVFPDPELKISMDLKNANIQDILKVFSMQAGINFIAAENVQDRKMTLYLDGVPIKEAMDKLLQANNLTYEVSKDSNVVIIKDWGKLEPNTQTRVFALKYASVASAPIDREKLRELGGQPTAAGIAASVVKLLSTVGTLVEDARTNSLIVTDVPTHMEKIAATIKALDVPVPLVMLEVEMLDVSKGMVDKLGVKYGEAPLTLNYALTGATVGTKFPFGSLLGNRDAITDPTVGKVGKIEYNSGSDNSPVSTYQIVLNFLKTATDTRSLARPRILTLNNEVAEIKITTQETVGTINTTSTGGAQQPVQTVQAERMETGVSLRVTPQVNVETGEITMFVVPKVRDTVAATLAGISAKDPEERSTRSMVRVKDGETVIMGGLLRNDFSETKTRIPFFSDLPIVGAAFRHRAKDKDKERELLVFITPHIVKDTATQLAQAKQVVMPEREQNTLSGFDRQKAISSSLNNFESSLR